MLNSGQHPLTPASVQVDHQVPAAKAFTSDLQEAVEAAKAAWASAQDRQAQYANQKRRDVTYKVGDSMLLSTKNIRLKNPGAKKLLPRWIGPYKVVKKVNKAAFQLGLPEGLRIHDVFHVSLLRPYDSDGAVQPPPPILFEGQEEFEVDRILEHRDRRLRKRGHQRISQPLAWLWARAQLLGARGKPPGLHSVIAAILEVSGRQTGYP